jgi:hypothetical protein
MNLIERALNRYSDWSYTYFRTGHNAEIWVTIACIGMAFCGVMSVLGLLGVIK